MHETTPSVFILARPALDLDGLRGYLRDVGGESWLDRRIDESGGEPNPGELLVEFGGRACYRSWEPGLNPNVTRIRTDPAEYFGNLLRSGHGSVLEHANYSFAFRNVSRVFCYSADTEVLTADGWKQWPDVDGSETFATLNPDTDRLEYQPATEHFVGDYDGPMYQVRSDQVDLLVTPSHRMWVKAHPTRANRHDDQPYRVRLAHQIIGEPVAYQKTATWAGRETGTVTIPGTKRVWARKDNGATRRYVSSEFPLLEYARFLGHWLAGGGTMTLPACEAHAGHGAIRTPPVALRETPATRGTPTHEKSIPDYVHTWGPSILRAFLEAYVDGAGSRRPDGNQSVIHTTSRETADDLQVLAIKAGWSADIDRTGLDRVLATGQHFKNAGPCYVLSLVKTRTHPLVNRNGAKQDSWEQYAGKVYCVKVPNGLLFVRRNGKAVVSGNTHELVRHRAGSAFSQESLRYVRLTDLGFRVPPALEPVRDQVLSIVEQLEEFQLSAAEALGIDADGVPFHVKKEATSALRRLAPIGLSTDIIWTANLRTLRHVIEMRTAEGAEEELRIVFDLLARLMQREAPHIFADFTQDEAGSWVPAHRKV